MKGVGKNAKMRTKPRPIVPEKEVRGLVQAIFTNRSVLLCWRDGLKIGFREHWCWLGLPTLSNGFHQTRVDFYGNKPLQAGYALYTGPFGIWDIDLVSQKGPAQNEREYREWPCMCTWGKAKCHEESDEWRESKEQRRVRLEVLLADDPEAVSRGPMESSFFCRLD